MSIMGRKGIDQKQQGAHGHVIPQFFTKIDPAQIFMRPRCARGQTGTRVYAINISPQKESFTA